MDKKSSLNIVQKGKPIEGGENYFAIEVPLRRNAKWLGRLHDILRDANVKWQNGHYHITMSFICGHIDYCSAYVVMVQRKLENFSVQHLTFDKLGAFTARSGEHIVYLTVSNPDTNFINLVNMIRGEVNKYDVKQADFRLHVTLGRIDGSSISLEELQKRIEEVELPRFTLRLSRVYHRFKGYKDDHKSWELGQQGL